MGIAERRKEILYALYRRKYEKISNLAKEFGVSERTISRDIEVLSLTEPIYTQCGRFGGGVYINIDYKMEKMYMSSEELAILIKLKSLAKIQSSLTPEESETLENIISQYTKPTT